MIRSAMGISMDLVVHAADEQVSCELSGEVVVLSLRSGEYFGLNPVAAAVWALVQSPRTVLEIRDALLEQFAGVSEEKCTEELLPLIEELRVMELVTVS